MSPKSLAFKQKKRVKNARNKYLKPGALAHLHDARTTTKSRCCTDIGKKRIVLEYSAMAKLEPLNREEVTVHSNAAAASPIRSDFQPMVDGHKQQKLPETPKTPEGVDCDNQSRLESLPIDLLVGNNKSLIGPLFCLVVLNVFGFPFFLFISNVNSEMSSGLRLKSYATCIMIC